MSTHAQPHPAAAAAPSPTAVAVRATLHCLTGCAIGEIAGLVIGTALGWGNAPTMVAAIVLAFAFGYALTSAALRRSGVPARSALRLAFASDTISIGVMEVADNAVMLAVPGAMAAGLGDGRFWWSLALSLVVAFLATVPVNRALIARGRGHAAIHGHHHRPGSA